MSGSDQTPRVVYRDRVLVVLNKPPGMPTQATRQGSAGTLEEWLRAQDGVNYSAFHHRLDAAAQGLVCAALDRSANSSLARSFRQREAKRTYRALVHGRPRTTEGRWHHLGRRRGARRIAVRYAQGAPGEEMIARWAMLEARPPYSLLEVQLETGRTHQIRLQASAEGHPILGDPVYGFAESGGLCLQACALSLRHPMSGDWMSWDLAEPGRWGSLEFG